MQYFNWIHKGPAFRLLDCLEEGEPPAGARVTQEERELAELGAMLRAARPPERPPSEAVKARIANRMLRAHLTQASEPSPAMSSHRRSGPARLRPRAMALISVLLTLVLVTGGLAGALLLRQAGGGTQVAWVGELTFIDGEVERCPAGGSWEMAVAGGKLAQGDTLRTAAGARAEALLANGDLFRLDDSSEIKVESYSGRDVRLTQLAGGSYHRSSYNTSYGIAAGDLDIRANDTAFVVDEVPETGEVRIMCLYSDVQVAAQQQSGVVTSSLVEGEKCRVTQSPDAGLQLQVDSMSAQDLDDDWLRWNRDKDIQRDLQLGVLARLPLKGLPGGQETVPGSGEQAGPNATGPGPAIPGASQSIVFSADATLVGIQLKWQVQGYDTISGFQIFRSGEAPADKATFTLDDVSRKGFLDTSARPDGGYWYQLALCEGDEVLALSEIINVSGVGALPVPQLRVEISLREGGVMVEGSLSGVAEFTSYVLIRSTSRSNPSYPLEAGESAIQLITGEPELHYWDGQVVPGKSYFYRLMLCQGDQVILRSNTARAVVPFFSGTLY